jgi:YbbR domain-containing protein
VTWRGIVTHNPWQKGFSVLLATLIWFTVRPGPSFGLSITGDRENERTFDKVAISVLSTASDTNTYRLEPAHVELRVRADPAIVSRLRQGDVEIYVNVTTPIGSPVARPIHVQVPSGVEIISVTPSTALVEHLSAGIPHR